MKTADAATVAPRKRRWRGWAIGLAAVVAAATIALLSTAPKPEPVRVWFVRATNEGGVKRLVFEGTNGITGGIMIFARAGAGAVPATKTLADLLTYDDWANSEVSEAASFTFSLDAPTKDVPYYVMWTFVDGEAAPTRWGRFRRRCSAFFDAHSMPRLAKLFAETWRLHFIPSTEIKE